MIVAIESAALAEKLLNDLLKTTEGFQRLKKINEELKTSTSDEGKYVSCANYKIYLTMYVFNNRSSP